MTTAAPAGHVRRPEPDRAAANGGDSLLQFPLYAGITGITAISCGDRWTSTVQPFWALPLLAVAGRKIRDILGCTTVVLVVSGSVFGASLLLVGAG